MHILRLRLCILAQHHIMRIEPIHCHDSKLSNQIYTCWESGKVDFPYRRLGLVEVYGNADSDYHDLNDNLLFQARSMCANAIIHVYQEPNIVWNSNTERHDKKTKMVGIAVSQGFMQ